MTPAKSLPRAVAETGVALQYVKLERCLQPPLDPPARPAYNWPPRISTAYKRMPEL